MCIYMDNCCLNRPYDNQGMIKVFLETQAKLQIQQLVRDHKVVLCSSYMLDFENNENPYEMRKNPIKPFLDTYSSIYISNRSIENIENKARIIMKAGIKYKDACHIACALMAKCDYFITTDNRILKYQATEMKIVNPVNFFL